ncbi:hypothetical protein SEA_JUMBO_95 [Gordonia phage Jumbo]|uniref:Uncharacterized protein n=1 Tax=Gordonia phage Jumbo TaxID=1887650 RepID=A0A1B3B0S8_9CAUD|nr:hypothetical protein BIZ69_gp095 [Gordonia phage Jumbo]AOE44602.1 hypothetical protein SEA_JUMBO_95 [Gordonia phage Jumbo]
MPCAERNCVSGLGAPPRRFIAAQGKPGAFTGLATMPARAEFQDWQGTWFDPKYPVCDSEFLGLANRRLNPDSENLR